MFANQSLLGLMNIRGHLLGSKQNIEQIHFNFEQKLFKVSTFLFQEKIGDIKKMQRRNLSN